MESFEAPVYDAVEKAATEIKADFAVMYQSPNAAELYQMVSNRLHAGVPCVFCRIPNIPVTEESTDGQLLDGTIEIELIIAISALNTFEQHRSKLEKYKWEFQKALSRQTVLFQYPRPFRCTNLGRRLFKDNKIDAASMNYELLFTVDFSDYAI